MKACVRCKMQKIRVSQQGRVDVHVCNSPKCQIDTNDPSGSCITCQTVSTQKIHTLACHRVKITECTLFRTGKAPGLEFTFRWPVMKLRDISKWQNAEVRRVQVQSDVCPVPLTLSVRKFVPIPQDSLKKSWMDGKVKKYKETTPFAIVNMAAAVKDMKEFVNATVYKCLVSKFEVQTSNAIFLF